MTKGRTAFVWQLMAVHEDSSLTTLQEATHFRLLPKPKADQRRVLIIMINDSFFDAAYVLNGRLMNYFIASERSVPAIYIAEVDELYNKEDS